MGKGEIILNTLIGGLIFVALATVLLRKSSQTPAVLNSSGAALSNVLYAAEGSSKANS